MKRTLKISMIFQRLSKKWNKIVETIVKIITENQFVEGIYFLGPLWKIYLLNFQKWFSSSWSWNSSSRKKNTCEFILCKAMQEMWKNFQEIDWRQQRKIHKNHFDGSLQCQRNKTNDLRPPKYTHWSQRQFPIHIVIPWLNFYELCGC